MFINSFTQDRIRDPRKENLPKLTINLQLNYWKKTIHFPKFLIGFMMNRNMNSISCSLCTKKFPLARVHLYNFFLLLWTFLNLLYSDLPNFLHSIQISSNEAVGKYVQNVLAMASEVFCLVFLLVLLLQPSKVCFEMKGNNVDLYLNSHACPITPVQTHRILRLKQINYRLMFHFLSFSPKQSNAKGVVKCK